MKNILIINGHPDKQSFNHALSQAYLTGAHHTSASIDQINIGDLDFNPNLAFGYREKTALEPDLQEAIEKIKRSNHLVWTFPMWWYGYPAIMKGFVDRTFLPGLFFKYKKGSLFPDQLLKGKTARMIITSDTPRWYDRWFMKSPAINQFKKGTLEFCGIKPVKISYIGPVKKFNADHRQKWLHKIEQLGAQLK